MKLATIKFEYCSSTCNQIERGSTEENTYQVKNDKIEVEKGSGSETRAIIQLRELTTNSGRATSPN